MSERSSGMMTAAQGFDVTRNVGVRFLQWISSVPVNPEI